MDFARVILCIVLFVLLEVDVSFAYGAIGTGQKVMSAQMESRPKESMSV
jgi:hypothetical protein